VIPLGERHLRHLVSEYVVHYHGERIHQGLANELIEPIAANTNGGEGVVRRRGRLGGFAPTNLTANWPKLFEFKPACPEAVRHRWRLAQRAIGAAIECGALFVEGVSRASAGRLSSEQAKRVSGEVLVVSFVHDSPVAPPHARELRDRLGSCFVDAGGREWYLTAPARFRDGTRCKLEIVTDLSGFLDDEIAPRLDVEDLRDRLS
jgi:hypothetical protein